MTRSWTTSNVLVYQGSFSGSVARPTAITAEIRTTTTTTRVDQRSQNCLRGGGSPSSCRPESAVGATASLSSPLPVNTLKDSSTATGANCGAEVAACLADTLQPADPMLGDVAIAFMAWHGRRVQSALRADPPRRPAHVETDEIAAVLAAFTTSTAPPAAVHGQRLLQAANVTREQRTWFAVKWE